MKGDRFFEVGNVCRIREWEDMLLEFGGDESQIDCEFTFVEGMRELCGKIFTVASISLGFDDAPHYHSTEGLEQGWSISGDMLELISPLSSPESDFEAGDIGILLSWMG